MALLALPGIMSLMCVLFDAIYHSLLNSFNLVYDVNGYLLYADPTAKCDTTMPHEEYGYGEWEISRSTYSRQGG